MKKLFLGFSLILYFVAAQAQNENMNQSLSPYFVVNGASENTDALPLKHTSAAVNISGMIADVSVHQIYENKGKTNLECIYVFPASTRAAVYAMQMKIGKRIIKAKIKERNQARLEYETAKAEGKSTSLLEQERPNVFQMNVANIRPNDVIEVMLQYTEMIVPSDGVYQFVYPTVVGPRYNSKQNQDDHDAFAHSPYTKKGIAPSFTFDLKANIIAAVPLHNVHSKTHWIDVTKTDDYHSSVALKKEDGGRGNKDFVLNYQLRGEQFASGVMLYEHEKENFFMAMVQPPKAVKNNQIPPREYIFIVDVSGSMNGFPLDVSKILLKNLISNLRSSDYFNVLLFAGGNTVLSEKSLPATAENVQKAIQVIDNQRGGGGTELLPAMQKAMNLPRQNKELSRSLIFVTDGYVTVEKEAFDIIKNNLNQSNVFAFGIGSSVNRFLMEGLAHVGQGEPFFVMNQNEATQIAEQFRKYINTPVLSQINYRFKGFEAYDVEPKFLPDVMTERPIILFGKYKGKPKGTIEIEGYAGKERIVQTINIADNQSDMRNSALRYLWAREKLRYLDDFGGNGQDEAQIKEVVNLGLTYNLLTAHTSFLAIDETVVEKNGQLVTVQQALPMPEGVENSAIGADLELSESFTMRSSNMFKFFSFGLGIMLLVFLGYFIFLKK